MPNGTDGDDARPEDTEITCTGGIQLPSLAAMVRQLDTPDLEGP